MQLEGTQSIMTGKAWPQAASWQADMAGTLHFSAELETEARLETGWVKLCQPQGHPQKLISCNKSPPKSSMTTTANGCGAHVQVCEHVGAISHTNGESTPLVLLGRAWELLTLLPTGPLVSTFAIFPPFLSFLLLFSSGPCVHSSSWERKSKRQSAFFCGHACLTHYFYSHATGPGHQGASKMNRCVITTAMSCCSCLLERLGKRGALWS